MIREMAAAGAFAFFLEFRWASRVSRVSQIQWGCVLVVSALQTALSWWEAVQTTEQPLLWAAVG